MDCIIGQSKLSQLPKYTNKPQHPEYILKWNTIKPELRKLFYIHVIRAVGEYRDPHSKLSTAKLIENLAVNMGNIVKQEVQIYVENLLFYGYISESYIDGVIIVTDKLYEDLQEVDILIRQRNKAEVNSNYIEVRK